MSQIEDVENTGSRTQGYVNGTHCDAKNRLSANNLFQLFFEQQVHQQLTASASVPKTKAPPSDENGKYDAAMAISQRYLEKIVTNGPTNNNNPLQSIAAAQLAHAQNILLQDYYESGSDTSETNNSHPSSRQRRSKTIRDKDDVILPCDGCGKKYRSKTSLSLHKRLECGKEPAFKCPFCPLKTHQKGNLQVHMKKKHNQDYYTGVLNLSTSLFNGNAGGGNENALSITPPKISSSS
ncbi:hypothetical protein M8J77_002094 [Diaphorina citri]|nr:hypothetical protein M8J77_002094 [Diaphorina citri]